MTVPILLLAGGFLLVGSLLLILNLESAWRWPVKAGMILMTGLATVAFGHAIGDLLGHPTPFDPPAHFQLHAALVEEPGRGAEDDGAIFLWLSRKTSDGLVVGSPRAYALPYSRDLHEEVARARLRLESGRPVEGARRKGTTSQTPEVALFETPIAEPPSKPSN